MDTVALRLFGVIHVDRPGKVTAELDAYAADADALFVEYPETEPDWGTYGRCLLRAPAVFLGFVFVGLLQLPLFALLTREVSGLLSTEAIAADRVADDRAIPIHRVDEHPLFAMATARWPWIVANWGLLAGLGVLWPRALATTVVVVAGSWLLLGVAFRGLRALGSLGRGLGVLVGAVVPWSVLVFGYQHGFVSVPIVVGWYLGLAAVLRRTLPDRNRHMLERVAALSAEHGYDRGCLITGKAHLNGLVRLAAGRNVSITRTKASKWLRRSDDERAAPEPADGGVFAHPDPREPLDTRILSARTGAAVIDLVCVGVLVLPMAVAGGVVSGLMGDVTDAGILLGALSTPVVYGFALEAVFGRTIGKRLLGVVVVAADGSRCSTRRAAVRNLCRIVDFPLFYLVGFVVASVTERRQRLGDLIAGTVVTKADT